jgi:FlaA1/EpsC-like NDP-sugar epimerase
MQEGSNQNMTRFQSWINKLTGFDPNGRKAVKIIFDGFLITVSYALCYAIRFDLKVPPDYARLMLITMPVFVAVNLCALLAFRSYSAFWVFWGTVELRRLVAAHTLSVAALLAADVAIRSLRVPLSVYVMYWFIALLALSGFRMVCRWILVDRQIDRTEIKRLLVIGAGNAGEMLLDQVAKNPSIPFRIIGLIDDDPHKLHRSIHGVRVLGGREAIAQVVQSKHVDEVVIAIPSATSSQMLNFVQICEQCQVPFRTVPGPSEIIDGRVSINRLRPVRINDLLGREQHGIDLSRVRRFLSAKTVLVTGAAGSIGSELCTQILNFSPKTLLAIDKDENGIFHLSNRFREHPNVYCLVANAGNRRKMESFFGKYRPDIVFHAAAYKHVPCMEAVPDEAILNNLESTITTLECASTFGAQKYVQISTDKAVKPSSIMGVSKRLCELIVQNHTRKGRSGFLSVRFGNVIGSQGSVITVFEEQIREGKPLTVTHPDMKRFFMTIEEACRLVLEAAAIGKGGCIFGLDMGEPIRIVDLAKQMAALACTKPGQEIPIQFTGVRPGEKFSEELWYPFEKPLVSDNPKIRYVKNTQSMPEGFDEKIKNILDDARNMDTESMLMKIKEIIPEYNPV